MPEMRDLASRAGPDTQAFSSDPFGYSALAWTKWTVAQAIAGMDVEVGSKPTSSDLKAPVLWLAQAHALSEAARIVLLAEPDLQAMPGPIRGVAHCQYHAVGLMLVGYSLEICLKAMLILTKGIDQYTKDESKHKHHKLEMLAEVVPNLSPKDKAILRALTEFVMWAGRYPDPGSGREDNAESIFETSEKYQISARDLFECATRIMRHVKTITG